MSTTDYEQVRPFLQRGFRHAAGDIAAPKAQFNLQTGFEEPARELLLPFRKQVAAHFRFARFDEISSTACPQTRRPIASEARSRSRGPPRKGSSGIHATAAPLPQCAPKSTRDIAHHGALWR